MVPTMRVAILTLLACLVSPSLMAQVEVMGARVWNGADKTRLVFDLGGRTQYNLFTLDGPPRVVIDLDDATAGSALARVDLGTGPISQIRSARRGQHDLRIVLDLSSAAAPSHFLLPPQAEYGYRLVVDLRGAKPMPAPANDALAKRPAPPVERSVASTGGEPRRATYQVTDQVTEVQRPSQPRSGVGTARVVSRDAAPVQASAAAPTPVQATALARTPEVAPARDSRVVVAIDAGHGGYDPGAVGPGGLQEKDVVFAIAKELKAMIDREPGMRAVMIRDNDRFIPLAERARMARAAQADLFISIHANSIEKGKASGASVYTLSPNGASSEHAKLMAAKENSADLIGGVTLDDKDHLLASVLLDLSQTATIQTSTQIADSVLRHLKGVGKLHSRRVEQAGFMVLKSPDMPSILVETAFISDPDEARRLASKKFQRQMALAILGGVREHFVMNPPEGTQLAERSRQHTIARGETLSHIAARYQVNLDSLRRANKLEDDRVNVGDVLTIPGLSDS